MIENFISKWSKNEIKNVIEFYVNYKLSIQEISHMINKTEYDIKIKLIELKIVDPNNQTFIENDFIDYIDHINLLFKIDNDIKIRIKILESKILKKQKEKLK